MITSGKRGHRSLSGAFIWVALAGLATALPPLARAASKKQCIKASCRPQKKACVASFKQQLNDAKPGCRSDKSCRKGVRKAFRGNKKRCKKAFGACKACCKSEPTAGCDLNVFGDGLCGGTVAPAEECDGVDDALCPGQCTTSCTCGGSVDSPGVPIASGSKVGWINASKSSIVFVDASGSAQAPFRSDDSFLMTAHFAVMAPGEAPLAQGERIGPCRVVTDADLSTGTGGTDFAPLDPGSPGQVTNGMASVSLVPSDPGSFVAAQTSAQMFQAGFGADQSLTVDFPGGLDILDFSATVAVPPDLRITLPDFQDAGLRLDLSGPLDVAWSGDDPAKTLLIVLTGSAFPVLNLLDPPPADFIPPTTVATCTLPDTGSGVIPARVMSSFPAGANFVIFVATRSNTVDANVDLTAGGSGTVTLTGSTAVVWTFSDITVVTPKR